jgi:hypothetical protein
LKTIREKANDSFDEEFMDAEDFALIAKKFRKCFRPRKDEYRKPFKSVEKSKGDSDES